MVQLWFEKEAASEDFILLLLENMTARINWLPYRKDIRVSSMAIFLDYGNIRGSYGPLTKLMGFYRPVKYQFSFKTLLTLADELSNKGHVGVQKKQREGFTVMKEYD